MMVVSLVSVSGCLSEVIPAHAPADEVALQATLTARDYRGAGFVQLNTTPFASGIEAGDWVTMYVSKDAAAAYEAVSPDSLMHGAAFPVGGIIVRQVSDASGKLTALTAMVKRDAGYNPEVGDFFFGVADVDGTPETDDGQLMWGKPAACAGCHQQRADAGYLFGVETAVRTP